jgi:hypothetical protein
MFYQEIEHLNSRVMKIQRELRVSENNEAEAKEELQQLKLILRQLNIKLEDMNRENLTLKEYADK